MGEPIVLHGKGGKTLNVYSRSQAETLLGGGSWYATAADAEAGKVREEPTPTTAARLEALDGDAANSGVVKAAPPAPAGFEDVEAVEAIITVVKEPPAPRKGKAQK